MVGCILTGHGAFADGVGSALEMIAGPQLAFERVVFDEGEEAIFPDKLAHAVTDMLASFGEAVIFCDLIGGTPFNQAMLIAATNPGVRVVTGANLPMLLECMSLRSDGATAAELVDCAIEIGRSGIAAPVLDGATSPDSSDDDEEGI